MLHTSILASYLGIFSVFWLQISNDLLSRTNGTKKGAALTE